MAKKPSKPPAPLLVSPLPVTRLSPPCHAQEISESPLRMGEATPQNQRPTVAPAILARELRGASGDLGREFGRGVYGRVSHKEDRRWMLRYLAREDGGGDYNLQSE